MLLEVGANRPGLIATVSVPHGGRTVSLRLPGGPNLVDPGTFYWASAPKEETRPDSEWSQDFGQVVWLGPQSRFWADQTAIPARPSEAQGWPPDPICTSAPHAVVDQSSSRVRLRGPASPVWQVELTKTWTARPDGSIEFHARARNISSRPIRKGLWFNFRAPPSARVWIPVHGAGDVRVTGGADLGPGAGNEWLVLHPPKLAAGENSTDAKVYVRAARGLICVEAPGGRLELEFPLTPAAAVADGHAPVEIYRRVNRDSWSILEVEQHAPCVELAPGESMEHSEVWRWVGVSGRTARP